MAFLNYIYVFLWAALAVLTVVIGRKEGVLAWVIAGFFVFMAAWYGVRAFGGVAMFDGVLGVIFKCVLGTFAVGLAVAWFIKRR